MNSYVLIDENTNNQNIKVVDRNNAKVKFLAILQTCNEKNRNGRVYPLNDMKEAVDAISDRIKNKTFGGELDHPITSSDSDSDWIRHVTFLYKEASHAITDIRFEGNTLIGTVETLSTPNGRTLAGLISDGVKVGFSLRAISDNVEKTNDGDVVRSPITMISYDVVSYPSHANAYIKEITSIESVNIPECKNGRCSLKEHLSKYNRSATKVLESIVSEYRSYNLFPGKKFVC